MPIYHRAIAALAITLIAAPATASEVLTQSRNDYTVLLTPNDPLTVSFVVTVPAWTERPTDTFLVVETGGSFLGHHPVLKVATQSLTAGMGALNPDTQFGLGTFVDKPVAPFGGTNDYEYRTDLAVSNDVATWQTAVDDLVFFSGSDAPESQLTALLQIGLRAGGEVGFREDSLRIVVLATDSDYHEAGDFDSAPANDGDATLDGSPPGTGEDYPSVTQVKESLEGAGITPLFLSGDGVESFYDALVSELGIGASLVLTADASEPDHRDRRGARRSTE